MKKLSFFCCLLFSVQFSFAQVFWTETFGTSACTSVLANGSNASGMGTWLTSNIGINQSNANNWFISAREAGMGMGNCGDGCNNVCATGLTNRTLHISSTFITVDQSANYLAGNTSNTDRRAESPYINCTGKSNIVLAFNYLTQGIAGTDFAEVHYYDGTTWTALSVLAPTPLCTDCHTVSVSAWASTPFAISLPATANNNPAVKIGFRWTNTDPTGTNRSIAVDDITLAEIPPLPTTVSFTLPSPVCQTSTINASYTSTTSPTSFTWSSPSPNVVFAPANTGTTAISFTAPGTYTVSLTACQGATNCATATSSIQVLPTPTINVTASPTVICSTGSSTLTATGGISATSYTWAASSGATLPNSGTVVVTPTTTTDYTVTTSVPGCTTSISINLSVTPSPTITISPASLLCSGQSETLTVSGATSYTWSPAATLSSASSSTVTASPTITTSYTVIGSDGVCTNTAAVTVTVVPSSSAAVTPVNSTICSGQSTNLVASGGTSYTWTASSGPNPPNTATITVTPTTTTTYTVVTGAGSCTTSAVSSVSVTPTLSLTATPSTTTICSGTTGVSITATGATSYTWAPSAGLSATNTAVVNANPTVTTTYTLLGSNSSCTTSTLVTINVTSVNATVTASSLNYCSGGSPITLTASGATSYSWAPAGSLSSSGGAVVTATPAATTVYSVSATTGACTSVKTITITVSPTSVINIVSSNTVICPGGSGVNLVATGANTYTWSPGSVTTATFNANPPITTTYTVNGQNAAGCPATPAIITVSVAPAITPTLTASSTSICLTQTATISATPTGAYTYTWSPASAILGPVNASSIIARPTTTTPVIYTLLISNGLCTASKTIAIQASICIPPVSDFTTSTNDSICTNGCVTFSATSTGTQPMTYLWIFPGGTPPTSTQMNPQVCYATKGDYTVALISTNSFGTDTVIKNNFINVADTPSVVHAFGDTLIKVGQTAPIRATGGLTYLWTPNVNGSIACPTCSNTVVQPTVTTEYIVSGYSSPYCKRQDTILVRVDFTCGDFFVPNAFSPNGDGLNDMVNVHGFCIYTFNLQIFDRWGEKVFETSSKDSSWDGMFRGKAMDTGVFIYRADGITIDGRPFSIKGNITLIR